MSEAEQALDAMKRAIELRKQAITQLIAIGWTQEQAAQLEGAVDRAVRRWLCGEHLTNEGK